MGTQTGMTVLGDLLKARIAANGPITIADYMADCLTHPTHGYYVTRDPLGRDFVTAPEISQMFGELIGLSLAQAWLDQGAPARILLAELGPGRGTLMADILRATARVPGFHAAADVHFIEASPTLRAAQAKAVPNATWHGHVSNLPNGPLFLVANEFFDALPVRQFIRQDNGWAERMVGVHDDRLAWGLSSPAPLAQLAQRIDDTKDGDLVEVCSPLAALTTEIGTRIADNGGAALIIDYGDWRSLGDTLQAITAHDPVDALMSPGEADLTCHVDFEAICQNTAPAKFSRVTPQGVFLERLGITERAQQLAQKLSGDALDQHIAAHRRLTHPAEMGNLFKVVGLYPPDAAPPPGLDP